MNKGENIFDWSCYDWDAVNTELQKRKQSTTGNEEHESLPRDMFVEYVRWLHDNKPELFYIMVMMHKADQERAPQEELDKWKKLWDSYSKDC